MFKILRSAALAVCLGLVFAETLYAQVDSAGTYIPTPQWSSGVSLWQFVKVILILGVVLAALWFTIRLLKSLTGRRSVAAGGLEVVSGLSLGPRRMLVVVRMGAKLLLLGATDHHISHIATIDEPQEAAALMNNPDSVRSPFSALLKKFSRRNVQ
ncbi:MAG: flagellar biosynthetic protein FliO [Calditrichaeota bacterium]|nr:flagellar biosynthetic protein FliO [Calditrichota bacterium]